MTLERLLTRTWEVLCGIASFLLLVMAIAWVVWALGALSHALVGTPHP